MAEKKTSEKKAEQTLTLHQKMLEVMKSIERLQKDTEVGYNGKAQYKAMSEEKVTSTVRAKFVELGILVYPFEQEVMKEGNITTTNTKYRMVNVDDPLDYVDLASSGQGADTQDKGVGKAMTYAYKYMLLRTFAIPTGEDPDKIHSDELTDKFKAEEKKKKSASKSDEQTLEGKIKTCKALIQETEADTKAMLTFFSDKYKREIGSVDEMVEAELNEAIKMLMAKKGDK